MSNISIINFDNHQHRSQVMDIWRASFGYDTAHNEPGLVIDKKIVMDDGLFFVAMAGETVVGTVMAGYDGHRGWLYSVSVKPSHRKLDIGSQLVCHAENALVARGCVKINLQMVASNAGVAAFYEALGYRIEPRVSMGKLISGNIPSV